MQPKFKPGDKVKIRVDYPLRHVRTPAYIQGKVGFIEAMHGAFRNPESLAYGGDGLPMEFLYLVCFDQIQVWSQHKASSQDKLFIDIYEHWLEPVL